MSDMSEAMQEAVASVPAHFVKINTVEFHHPAFVEDGEAFAIRAADNTEELMLPLDGAAPLNPGETVKFKAIPHTIVFPEQSDGQVGSFEIKVTNVGRELDPYLEQAVALNTGITVIVRVYAWNTKTRTATLGMGPFKMTLFDVETSSADVVGSASIANLANLAGMREVYDRIRFPSLR